LKTWSLPAKAGWFFAKIARRRRRPGKFRPRRPEKFSPPIMGDEMVPSWGRKPIQGNGVDYLMEGDLERKAEQALVAITLSTATLIVCVGLLVVR